MASDFMKFHTRFQDLATQLPDTRNLTPQGKIADDPGFEPRHARDVGNSRVGDKTLLFLARMFFDKLSTSAISMHH